MELKLGLDISAKNFLKISIGNVIEWYDFALYGIFAVAISRNFFSKSSPSLALLLTLLTYSVSFLARPLGAFIFGIIGDKFGKHYSVNISVWCMAISTVAVGLLPTYSQLGVLAPVLLLILRTIQGASVGGQFSGLIAIATDNDANKSYLTSIAMSISVIGNLLAILVGTLSAKTFGFFSEALSWRIPFLFSGVLFYVYYRLNPEFEKSEVKNKISIKEPFKNQRSEMIYMIILAAIRGSIHYILFNYILIFMQAHLNIKGITPLLVMHLFLITSLFCYPLFGRVADKCKDRIANSKVYTLLFILSAFMLSFSLQLFWMILCLFLCILFYCAVSSHVTSLFAEVFHYKYRMFACALCYNIGSVISGFSPFLSELLTKGIPTGFYMLLLILGFALYVIQDKIRELRSYALCEEMRYRSSMNANGG